MSEHDDLPGLSEALGRAAGAGDEAYTAADVAGTARRRRRRRAVGGGIAVLALVAGVAAGFLGGDDDPSGLDIVGEVTTTTTTIDDTDPPTTSTATASVPTDPSTCAAPMDDRQPLRPSGAINAVDLDGDGDADPIFFVSDEELSGSWVQMDRSTDGASTTAIRLDGVFGSETFLEAADLDGDGLNEGFLELAGNTLVTGIILEMEGCELRAITTDEPAFDYGDGIFTYPISAGGNGCSPTGCVTAVYCLVDPGTGDVFVEFVQTFPVTSALDPDFDPNVLADPSARNLPIRVEEQTVAIRDGVATVVATESASLDGGSLSIEPMRHFANHVDCDITRGGGEGCHTSPTIVGEAEGWSLRNEGISAHGPGFVAQWERTDGALVNLSNPGRVMVGDGEMGRLTIDGRLGTIAAIGADSRIGPHMIIWNYNDVYPSVTCERWTLWSAALGPIEIAAFAAEVLGASEVEEWYRAEPAPYLDDEQVLELAFAVLDALREQGGTESPLGTDAGSVEIFAGDERWYWSSSSGEALWAETDVAEAFAGTTRADWDVILGHDTSCAVSSPGLDRVHQITFTSTGGGDGCGLGATSVHLYLHGDGTLHTIAVDSVTG